MIIMPILSLLMEWGKWEFVFIKIDSYLSPKDTLDEKSIFARIRTDNTKTAVPTASLYKSLLTIAFYPAENPTKDRKPVSEVCHVIK